MCVLTDSKKSKMAKSPCTTDSSTSIGEKFESSGKLALTRQSSSGVGGGRGEGEDGNVHSGMGVNDKGEVGKITSKIGMPLDQKTVETDATGSEVQEVDCTATSQECLVADGNDHVIPPGQGVRLSPCRDVKLDLSNSGQSPPQCASLSPPDQSSAEVRLCEGGGSDEGIVTAVMSEEEEGPLDSSMEDLPSSPPLALTFPITTVDTDSEALHVHVSVWVCVCFNLSFIAYFGPTCMYMYMYMYIHVCIHTCRCTCAVHLYTLCKCTCTCTLYTVQSCMCSFPCDSPVADVVKSKENSCLSEKVRWSTTFLISSSICMYTYMYTCIHVGCITT